MKDKDKTKDQLLEELRDLRAQVKDFEKISAEWKRTEKELRLSESRFRTIFEHAPVMINAFTNDGRYCLLWNKECRKALGWTIDDLNACGDPLSLCYPDPDVKEKVVESIVSQERNVFREWYPVAKDGSHHVHMWANFELPDGALISIGYDVTERKRVEETLREARERAEQLNEAKTEFLMNVSHDIRTPMNVINGFNELLLETPLNKEQKKLCSMIKRKGSDLISLIEDVIDIAAVEKGIVRIHQSPFKIKDLAEDIRETVIAQIEGRDISFSANIGSDVPSRLMGDSMRLRQILENLCGNAVKYTEKGRIGLTISVGSGSPGNKYVSVCFAVKDTGIGIPEDKIPHIFEPYSRFHESQGDKNRDGVGMGLHIVQTLVKEMSGNITVGSTPGKGSEFLVELPMKKPEVSSKAAKDGLEDRPDDEIDLSALDILIAEDDEDSRELMSLALGKADCNIQFACDGNEALEKMKKKKYDLVLMDLRMPRMDGFKATEMIRKEIDKSVPIVALTAHVMDWVEDKCRDAGMNGYISKPVDIDKLKRSIKDHVK